MKVAKYKRNKDQRYDFPTHEGILSKVANPSQTMKVQLTEFVDCWGTTKKVLYRKRDGLQRGKTLTSIWQLDLDSIKPLETSNET